MIRKTPYPTIVSTAIFQLLIIMSASFLNSINAQIDTTGFGKLYDSITGNVTSDNKSFERVEIEASFPGGSMAWERFLERKLNANVPIRNGAPEGRYTVWMQYVIDKEGNVSEFTPLSKNGFGMEEEFMRVLKLAPRWQPAMQNGVNLRSYRKQPITFIVSSGKHAKQMTKEKVKQIKLENFDLDDFPETTIPVSEITVIPSLWDSSCLGIVKIGLINNRVRAIPTGGFESFLQNHIKEQYKDFLKTGGVHLLFIVRDLRINESTSALSENAFVRLRANAWVSRDSDNYSFVCDFDTVLTRVGVEVTSRHERNIAQALNLLLKQTTERISQISKDSPSFTYKMSEITQAAQDRFKIFALLDEEINDGVFVSFKEFLDNSPSITNYHVKMKGRKAKILAGESDQDLRPWGICKEREVYRYFNGDLIPLEKNDHGFIISTFVLGEKRKNNGVYWRALTGGLAGQIMWGTSSKIYPVTGFSYINKLPEATSIDMETGKLTF